MSLQKNKIIKKRTITNHFSPEWAMFFCIFFILAGLSVAKYSSLHSTYFDLGVFQNHFTNIAKGEWSLLFFGHTQPLTIIFLPLYLLLPVKWISILVLALQAAVLSLPVIWLYRFYGSLPPLIYALYFPLWYNALFDYHPDHFAVILLFGFFFLIKNEKEWLATICALLLMLVKEPFALQTVFCGIYLLIVQRRWPAGTLLIVAGLTYFIVANHYLLPYFTITAGKEGALSGSAFSWLGGSMGEMIWFVLSKPHIILWEIVTNKYKVFYLISIFGALGFISLLRPRILLVALPVIAISLLSKHPSHYGLVHHYTAGLIAPLMIAFSEGLPKCKQIWARVGISNNKFLPLLLTVVVGFHIILAPSPMSIRFWIPNSWAYNFKAYMPTDRDHMIKMAIESHIPKEQNIVVSTQNTVNWEHLAHRKYYFSFPYSVIQPHEIALDSDQNLVGLLNFIRTGKITPVKTEEKLADYVILDLKRPWFIGDRGCNWRNDTCQSDDEIASQFQKLVRETKEIFETIFEKDDFYILKRRGQ